MSYGKYTTFFKFAITVIFFKLWRKYKTQSFAISVYFRVVMAEI
jgi:hypothetical protein